MRNEEPKSDVLSEKSFDFSLRIIKLFKFMKNEHKEYIISKQILRSGTAIGALVREAKYAHSRPDFLNKLTVALKEANETYYWLELLWRSEYIDTKMYRSIEPDIDELLRLLISSTKTTKEGL